MSRLALTFNEIGMSDFALASHFQPGGVGDGGESVSSEFIALIIYVRGGIYTDLCVVSVLRCVCVCVCVCVCARARAHY